jgi:hypothetical protein
VLVSAPSGGGVRFMYRCGIGWSGGPKLGGAIGEEVAQYLSDLGAIAYGVLKCNEKVHLETCLMRAKGTAACRQCDTD